MTALNLPADILDAIEGYREALILRVLHRRLESAEQDAALDNLTALLSGYVEKAASFDRIGKGCLLISQDIYAELREKAAKWDAGEGFDAVAHVNAIMDAERANRSWR